MEIDLLFDARHIRQSGIGTYIGKQLPLLQERMRQDRLTLAVLADPGTELALDDRTTVIGSRPAGATMYSVGEQKAWVQALRRARPKAMWLPHYPFPLTLLRHRNRGILTFVTVHDTIHLLQKSISGQGAVRRMYARTMLKIDARKCTEMFAASETTAEHLRHVAPHAPIRVAPHPVDAIWLTPVDPGLSPVRGKYILYVGNVQRHKNLPVLLSAFREVSRAVPHKLVIAGGGHMVRSLDERIRPVVEEIGDRVEVIGRLEFEQLRSLVAGADVLVMPSLIEGVGMPPLEAMASRTAVISSDIPALRETCGDGAEYFDPHDSKGLSRLIRTYCLDDSARAALANRGWSHVTARQSALSFTIAVDVVCSTLTATQEN